MKHIAQPQQLTVIAIAAIGERTRAIGKNGQLLWKIPGDLPRFKQITMGHPILMGRATFDSIGRPLPGRTNLVLTRDPNWTREGVIVVHHLDEALRKAEELDSVLYVIGGGSVYENALSRSDVLLLTIVRDDAEGDAFFPPYEDRFHETTAVRWTEGTNVPPFRFSTWERNGK